LRDHTFWPKLAYRTTALLASERLIEPSPPGSTSPSEQEIGGTISEDRAVHVKTSSVSSVGLSSDLTFITNEQGKHLSDRFAALLGSNTRFFDCLVGYFFISGFHRLHPALSKTEKIRILIGIQTDRSTYELLQTAKAQREFVLESHAQVRQQVPGEILTELQKSGDSSEIEDGVRKFVEWINLKSWRFSMISHA
jgi:hypothetical protein